MPPISHNEIKAWVIVLGILAIGILSLYGTIELLDHFEHDSKFLKQEYTHHIH